MSSSNFFSHNNKAEENITKRKIFEQILANSGLTMSTSTADGANMTYYHESSQNYRDAGSSVVISEKIKALLAGDQFRQSGLDIPAEAVKTEGVGDPFEDDYSEVLTVDLKKAKLTASAKVDQKDLQQGEPGEDSDDEPGAPQYK